MIKMTKKGHVLRTAGEEEAQENGRDGEGEAIGERAGHKRGIGGRKRSQHIRSTLNKILQSNK